MTTTRDLFREAVEEAATRARTTMPACNGRIDAAVKLVLAGDVELHDDGTASVGSGREASQHYTVNGTCDCRDFSQAPDGWCKHRLARALEIRAARATRDALDAVPPGTAPEPSQASDAPLPVVEGKNGVSSPTVHPQFVVMIQGKPFVRFAGLLQMAHEQHLVDLTECWTYNDETLSLAHAVAIFEDGRRFESSGDATRDNVNRKVVPHFRRVALTHAKSRALRDAMNIDMVAVEELGEDL